MLPMNASLRRRAPIDRQDTLGTIGDIREDQCPLSRDFWGYVCLKSPKASSGWAFGARDVIIDLKANQQRLERELSDMKAKGGQQ